MPTSSPTQSKCVCAHDMWIENPLHMRLYEMLDQVAAQRIGLGTMDETSLAPAERLKADFTSTAATVRERNLKAD